MGLQPLITGRLKNKKQPAQPVFLAEPLAPTATRPLSRGRELERGQQAARLVLGRLRCLGKIAAIRGMPSPQPSPTGEGAGCSRFRRCRSSEKECPKHQQREFFRQPLSQGRSNKRRERFFRRPLNPSEGCVPQGTRAVGWGCRENEERVRAYRTHPTCRLLHNLFSLQQPLIPTAARPLSRGRELERGQQAARLVFGRFRCWERLPQLGECPLPNPPPRGREQIAADSGVAGRLKKNARNINGRNFLGSLYRQTDVTNAASVFSDDL